MSLILYTTYNAFILFVLLEYSKITLFKDLLGKIIQAIVAGKCLIFAFFRDLELRIISSIKSLYKVFLDDSVIPNRIVQMNVLYVIYIVINI